MASVTENDTTTGDGVRFHTVEDADGSCHHCPRGALRQAPGDAEVPPEVQPCTRTCTQVQDGHVRREQLTGPRGQRKHVRTDLKTPPPHLRQRFLKTLFQNQIRKPEPLLEETVPDMGSGPTLRRQRPMCPMGAHAGTRPTPRTAWPCTGLHTGPCSPKSPSRPGFCFQVLLSDPLPSQSGRAHAKPSLGSNREPRPPKHSRAQSTRPPCVHAPLGHSGRFLGPALLAQEVPVWVRNLSYPRCTWVIVSDPGQGRAPRGPMWPRAVVSTLPSPGSST